MSTPYITTTDARYEAGFQHNPDVTEERIESYVVQGHSIVESYIAAVYSLPALQVGAPYFA